MQVENFRHSGWENSTQHSWETLREEPTVIMENVISDYDLIYNPRLHPVLLILSQMERYNKESLLESTHQE